MKDPNSAVQYFNLFDIDKAVTTKEKILHTALDLFSKLGYHGVSIREITRNVGIKESSLYNHFRSKEEILECILHSFRREFATILPAVDRLDEILADSTIDEFLHKGIAIFKKHFEHPVYEKVWRIIYTEYFRHSLAKEIFLNDMICNTLSFLEIVFTKAIAAGKVREGNPRIMAAEYQYPVFAMLAEYNVLKFNNEDTTRIQQTIIDHINYFLESIKR